MAESWKKLKTLNLFSSFIVSSNRNRSALVCELLCNNSLFVGQLYEDKSLALHARDLIFFMPSLHLAYDEFTAIVRCLNSHFRAISVRRSYGDRTISCGFWAS